MFQPQFPWDNIGITQYFKTGHKAIDNAGSVTVGGVKKPNKYAYLPCDAKILKNTYANDYGYYVEYEAYDGKDRYVMANGHFSAKSNLVVGKTYSKGTIIGTLGVTGNTTGKHDHFRIAKNGVLINPLTILRVYPGQGVHNDDKKKVLYY